MVKVFVGNNVTRRAVIVDENTSLRKVSEDNQIDYSLGMTTLDGATLQAGELDKSFKDFGITEQCYLMNTAKAVNAAGIKVIGNTVFVESEFTPAELKEVSKYRPQALQLVDEETKEPIFAVGITAGDGTIGKFGAEYGSASNADGKALISKKIPDGVDAKRYIEDTIGVSILLLKKVEAGLSDKLAEIEEEKEAVMATIEVL